MATYDLIHQFKQISGLFTKMSNTGPQQYSAAFHSAAPKQPRSPETEQAFKRGGELIENIEVAIKAREALGPRSVPEARK